MNNSLANKERILFCEQMAMLLKAGISVTEGVMMMKDDAGEEEALRNVYERLQQGLEETGVFWDALEETGAFPAYMVTMVRIGEQTGNLDEVMEGLAAYYTREENMVQDIKSAVTYPLVMLGMLAVIVVVMLVKVLPVFARVYAQLGSEMTGMAAVLLNIGLGLRRSYGWIIFVLLLLGTGILWMKYTGTGRKIGRKLLNQVLSSRQIMEKISVARFAAGMSMALRSGMDYDGAFRLMDDLLKDDHKMKEKLAVCQEKLQEGESFPQAVVRAKILGGMQARILYVAERTGDMDAALARVAGQADEEVTIAIRNFVAVLEPTLVAVLSVLVGGILLAVMFPLLGVLSSIG